MHKVDFGGYIIALVTCCLFFFVIIFKIFIKMLFYVNILIIFTPELKTTTKK